MTVDVPSPVVGTVVSLAVQPKDAVAAGAEVMVIESMKMEIPVTAPAGGHVAAIAVCPGDHVRAGDVLLTITD
jgi:acetyl-CoA carboxylase biotin carboxyl carrier protein